MAGIAHELDNAELNAMLHVCVTCLVKLNLLRLDYGRANKSIGIVLYDSVNDCLITKTTTTHTIKCDNSLACDIMCY